MSRLFRTQRRVPYVAPVSVAAFGEGSCIAGEALNLSVAGIFVRSAAACSPGSEVFCDVALPDGVSRLKGRVARLQRLSDATGMGIQFYDLSDHDLAVLQDVVQRGPGAVAVEDQRLPSVIVDAVYSADPQLLSDTTEVGPAPSPTPGVGASTVWWRPSLIVPAFALALGVAALGWRVAATPAAVSVGGTAQAVGVNPSSGGLAQAVEAHPPAPVPSTVPAERELAQPVPVLSPPSPPGPEVVPLHRPASASAPSAAKPARRKRQRPPAALTFDPDTKAYRLNPSVALDLAGARLTNVAGLASAPQTNLRGIDVAVPQDASEMRVQLAEPEGDSSYAVQVTPSWPTVIAISDKTIAGFTIKFGTAAPPAATFDWFLVR